MNRLALCGWTEDAPRLLRALQLRARLEAVAVGDRQPVQLVRARGATGLPCYQHVLEMLRTVALDAVVITEAAAVEELANIAAARGVDLLLCGDAMTGAALEVAAEAAWRHRVALAVIRPRLRSAGLAFLADLVAADASWQPRFASVDVAGPAAATVHLRTGVALIARLLPALPATAIGSVLDGAVDDAYAIAAQLRGEGMLAAISAHTEAAVSLRLVLQSPAGTADLLTTADGNSTLTITTRSGAVERSTLLDTDLLSEEAARVAAIRRGDTHELLAIDRETGILRALEGALATGAVTLVDDQVRPELHVLDGGAHECAPRRGHLRLIGA